MLVPWIVASGTPVPVFGRVGSVSTSVLSALALDSDVITGSAARARSIRTDKAGADDVTREIFTRGVIKLTATRNQGQHRVIRVADDPGGVDLRR
jgi:hypothetical protein